MSIPVEQKPVKLIASVIFRQEEFLERAGKILKSLYGPTEGSDATFDFSYTDYYYKEMGRPLKRKLLCFEKLVQPENISRIKLRTNRIEGILKERGRRTVNIDPGYVTEAKLVLLTAKDYTHRIYIGRRIFAESTLYFMDDTFRPWPWTYPDYGSVELINYFNHVRELYICEQIKHKSKRDHRVQSTEHRVQR